MSERTLPHPSAALLIIGSEITEGRIIDRHGSFLATTLSGVGYAISEIVAIPDQQRAIVEALQRLMSGNSVVVATGGLGPTSDDCTLKALHSIEGTVANSRQLKNRVGLAPGVITECRGCWLALLPGPVGELQPMVNEQLLPHLFRVHHIMPPRNRLLSLFGVPESHADRFLQHYVAQHGKTLQWGSRIGDWKNQLILYNGAEYLPQLLSALRHEFGYWRVLEGDADLNREAVQALTAVGWKLVCAESCSAGLLLARIAAVAGASQALWGGAVVYGMAAKQWLGVAKDELEKYGTVSEQSSRALAHQALVQSKGGAQVALAITCVAGPTPDEQGQALGTTWIALEDKKGRHHRQHYRLRGSRESIQRKAVIEALVALLNFLEH